MSTSSPATTPIRRCWRQSRQTKANHERAVRSICSASAGKEREAGEKTQTQQHSSDPAQLAPKPLAQNHRQREGYLSARALPYPGGFEDRTRAGRSVDRARVARPHPKPSLRPEKVANRREIWRE